MKGRGNPRLPLSLLLLLVIYSARAAGQDTTIASPPPGTNSSLLGDLSSTALPPGTSPIGLVTTKSASSTLDNSVLSTPHLSPSSESVGVTGSLTPGSIKPTDTMSTVSTLAALNTTSPLNKDHSASTEPAKTAAYTSEQPTTTALNKNGSVTPEITTAAEHTSDRSDRPSTIPPTSSDSAKTAATTVPDSPSTIPPTSSDSATTTHHTPDMSDRPSTIPLTTNDSPKTQTTAVEHTFDMADRPSTTPLNYSDSAKTETTTEAKNTSDVSHRPSTTPLPYSGSTTEAQRTSDLSDRPSTTPQNYSDSAKTETTRTQHTSDMSVHPSNHTSTTLYSSLPPESVTTPSLVNSTAGGSSTANTAATIHTSTFSGNVTGTHGASTDMLNRTTKSPSIFSTTTETAPSRGSTDHSSGTTVSAVTSTNITSSTTTIQRSTSNDTQTSSSVPATKSTLTVETSTISKNETAVATSPYTTTFLSITPSLSPSTVGHTDASVSSTTSSGAKGTSTADSNPCRSIVCAPMSVCTPFRTGYVCVTGKTFPGVLHINSMEYTTDMAKKDSPAFLRAASEIESVLNKILENERGYIGSTVTKLSSGSVVADVENVFQLSSNATSQGIESLMETFIKECSDCGPLRNGDTFKEQDLCSVTNCDNTTTVCQSNNDGVYSCNCKEGFLKSFPLDQTCTACASGYKLEDKKCVKCPFGYAGFNCDDSSLLAVVVISCVLGSLLLILAISLLIACYRSKEVQKESYEHETYLMWPKRDVPKLPRVTMNRDSAALEYGSKNILMENDISNGNTINPEVSRTEGDLKTFTNANSSRYSYLCQGQTNPYFVNEDQ
ncbi:mucin-13-like [Ambystoma mexicanum]|uniref:mucin-13-like n=1 Tax=Ambystoma mexicanum TaxID=8296 RepID=UPI0037E823C7